MVNGGRLLDDRSSKKRRGSVFFIDGTPRIIVERPSSYFRILHLAQDGHGKIDNVLKNSFVGGRGNLKGHFFKVFLHFSGYLIKVG